ncbi:putative transcriptional regulator [Halopseudomonas litoralis]|uniref:Putative transcriptional regulator n=1 Tax=Halopseudomonas litoralis TaxID=797277 RepID=A0A1H1NUX3_9GAMM|nr:helix-turn-helix transcriptional regulator [Halopseudomonas litoralis]SDS02610.1 putative transcriptional regulator [Halopseudomonas litoralis]
MSALTKARKKAGLTQRELASRLGLTQGAIAHYEAGRRVPRLDDCRRIVAAFNEHGLACNLEEVFPETSRPERAA